MTSVLSMPHSAPSENSAGSHANAHYADQPLPPKGQQDQSWLQSTVQRVRGLWKTMPEDAQAKLARAKALINESGGFDWSFRGVNGFADSPKEKKIKAIDLYKDVAGEFFRTKNKKVESGDTFKTAALLELEELQNDPDIITNCRQTFYSAFSAYNEVRPLEAARCLQQAVELCFRSGGYTVASQWSDKLGVLYLKKLNDPDKAIEAWQNAGDWYKDSQSMSLAVGCYKKAGDACAEKGDYYKAIEIWEWCADNYPDSTPAVKSSQTVGFFYNAGLCHIATGDTVALSRALQHYVNLDRSFGSTREYRFLFDLFKAMEAGDEKQFELVQDLYKRTGSIPADKQALLDAGLERLKAVGDDFS